MKLDVKPSFPTAFMRYVRANEKYLQSEPQAREGEAPQPRYGRPGRIVGVLWSNKAKRQSDSLERLAEAYFRAGYTRDNAHEAVAAILGDRLSRNYWEDAPVRVAGYALPILDAMHDRGDLTLGGSALVAFFTRLSPYGQPPQTGEPPQGPAGGGPGPAPGRHPPRDRPEERGPEGRQRPPAGPRPGQPAEGAPRQGPEGYVALGFAGVAPPGAYNPFPDPFSGFHPALATWRGQKTSLELRKVKGPKRMPPLTDMDPCMVSAAPERSYFEAPPRRQRRTRNPDAEAALRDLDRLAGDHARADCERLGRRGRDEIN